MLLGGIPNLNRYFFTLSLCESNHFNIELEYLKKEQVRKIQAEMEKIVKFELHVKFVLKSVT